MSAVYLFSVHVSVLMKHTPTDNINFVVPTALSQLICLYEVVHILPISVSFRADILRTNTGVTKEWLYSIKFRRKLGQ